MMYRDDDMMTNYSGQYLGNYRLLYLLGKGGYASVYLGEHIYLKRLAAIKILHTVLREKEKIRFLKEARLLAGLSHPHIVRVLEFDVMQYNTKALDNQGEKSIPFLIMDYVPGGSLRTVYPAGSCLFLEAVVDTINQVAVPLQYAHNQGIIHRDIKPENLLLNEKQEVMLSDFGLALFAPSPELLSLQEVAGSLPYSAPEQLRGKPHFASDQYSLGIIAYEWLCGHRPFQGEDIEMVMQHVSSPPPSLRSQNPVISEAVEEVILIALAKDPQRRYASVQEFARALENASKLDHGYFSVHSQLSFDEREVNDITTQPFSYLDSDFELIQSSKERNADKTKAKRNLRRFAKKESPTFKKRLPHSPVQKWTIALFLCVPLLLILLLNTGGFNMITGILQPKMPKPLSPPLVQSVLSSEANFSVEPVQVRDLTLVKNDSMFANGFSVLGPGQQVIVNLPVEKSSQKNAPRPNLTVTLRGLVSRANTQEGYAPISLFCNGQTIVSDFTLPGGGFNPNTVSFQVPGGFIKHRENQITLTVSSGAMTYFWIYNLSVLQTQL